MILQKNYHVVNVEGMIVYCYFSVTILVIDFWTRSSVETECNG